MGRGMDMCPTPVELKDFEGEAEMVVHRIQNTYLVIKDMPLQRSFYEKALGLKVKFADQQRWTQFAIGETSFSLSSADEAADGASCATVVFEAKDIEAVTQEIVAAGGRIIRRRDMGIHGRTVTFVDPEGNVAQLFERAAKRGASGTTASTS